MTPAPPRPRGLSRRVISDIINVLLSVHDETASSNVGSSENGTWLTTLSIHVRYFPAAASEMPAAATLSIQMGSPNFFVGCPVSHPAHRFQLSQGFSGFLS
jgi:hypothetical protein|eukprot:5677809-Prymnesium_polylepis.1